ncbi:gag-Pol polyprotein [Caerostris extrusa]|uniref:Gag-Pol polyprotein n=1 Tax=Caerostris extrusa TaxID=172846 RepID=A0AAV4NDX6_CAEEX|nr:gag-Pol polyprotein [Caerostris extrusa]
MILDPGRGLWYFSESSRINRNYRTHHPKLILFSFEKHRSGLQMVLERDTESQFPDLILQQVCFTLNISQTLIPVYFPKRIQCNAKTDSLAILLSDEHDDWHSKLPVIRFAMNTAVFKTMERTPTFQQFGRSMVELWIKPSKISSKVWVTLHFISKLKTKRLMPKRDGPYLISTLKLPTSHSIAHFDKPSDPIVTYHNSAPISFRYQFSSFRKRARHNFT